MIDQYLKRWIWWPIRQITGVFHLLPLIAAVILVVLLTRPGQLQELYLSYLEKPQLSHLLLAMLSFALLSAVLVIAHYSLSSERIRIIFAPAGGAQDDAGLTLLQRAWAAVLALVPWAALAWGLRCAGTHLETVRSNLKAAVEPLKPYPTDIDELMNEAARLSHDALLAGILVLVAGLAVTYLIDLISRSRRGRAMKRATILSIALLFICFAIAAWLGGDLLGIQLHRSIGPLAVMALAALFLFSAASALAYLSQKAGFPALTLVVVAIGSVMLFGFSVASIAHGLWIATLAVFIVALLSRQWPVAGLAALVCALAFFTEERESRYPPASASIDFDQPTANTKQALEKQFEEWLRVRAPQAGSQKYPVFIIAVQGGGIYAAVAASQFLSVLQDRCPSFAQHVFAISAVSGGAIGATIFHALAPRPQQPAPAGCGSLSPSTVPSLKSQTEEVMLDDHFSPIVASIVPDLLGASLGRSQAVEESFIHSAGKNAREVVQQVLRDDFSKHW